MHAQMHVRACPRQVDNVARAHLRQVAPSSASQDCPSKPSSGAGEAGDGVISDMAAGEDGDVEAEEGDGGAFGGASVHTQYAKAHINTHIDTRSP